MEGAPRLAHARRAKLVSRVAWAVVLIALLTGGSVVGSKYFALDRAESNAATLEASASDAAKAVDAASDALSAAETDLANAAAARDAEKRDADVASAKVAREWDAKVAAMARSGAIPTNPLTGLGLPTPELMQELNAKDSEATADWASAAAAYKGAEVLVGNARSDLETAQSKLNDAKTFNAAARFVVNEARSSLLWSGIVAGGVLLVLLGIAAAFWIAASRAAAEAAPAAE